MRELGACQEAFGRALLSGEALRADGTEQAGLDVLVTIHRNTSTKGLVDALAANYVTVAQLVGDEWFRACAVEYVRAHPARSPVLAVYGDDFPAFLASFAPAAELPYLPEVARIDRLWVESHTARDALPLTPLHLAQLPQSALATQRPTLHPATRITWVRHSAATIWKHHRSLPCDEALAVDDVEEGILLTRPAGKVEYQLLDRPAFEFLSRLREGASLGAAAEAALTCNAEADVARMLANTLNAGAYSRPLENAS